MAKIVSYMAHDVINNVEGQLLDYDQESLLLAEQNGIVFVAVYSDGTRARVSAADITEPEPMVDGVTIVKPEYVDARIDAVVNVLDTLIGIVDPGSAIATVSVANGEQVNPVDAFTAALDELKALTSEE